MKIEIVNMPSNMVDEFGVTPRQLEYIEVLMLKRGLGVDFHKHIMPKGAFEARHRITRASAGKLINALKEMKAIQFVNTGKEVEETAVLMNKFVGKG
jgi:hypothetical protein